MPSFINEVPSESIKINKMFDNAFSSPKGLPYLSEMILNRISADEENKMIGDEMEMHIDEEMQAKVMKQID